MGASNQRILTIRVDARAGRVAWRIAVCSSRAVEALGARPGRDEEGPCVSCGMHGGLRVEEIIRRMTDRVILDPGAEQSMRRTPRTPSRERTAMPEREQLLGAVGGLADTANLFLLRWDESGESGRTFLVEALTDGCQCVLKRLEKHVAVGNRGDHG